MSGRITDESGAVLPGVTVTATQTDTGFTRTVVTDETGSYVMPNLPTGPYRLEVSLQGFRTYAQTGIVLQVAATPTINAVLAVGNLEETVSVEAAAPLVDVQSAGIGEVVENERILELPLQGRQVTDLIVLAGGAVQTQTASNRAMQGGVGVSVAGGQSFGVAYLLDGAMHNNPQDNLNLPLPFPDALQEFSVATGGLSAQNGMHSGASVNAVTKSGTNMLHGNAFEFLRDKRFNATDPFAPARPRRQAQGRRPAAQPVRGHARRPDCPGQAVLLRRRTRARSSARYHRRTSCACRRRRCWPATSRRLRHRPATRAGRSRCARRSSTTGSIRRCSARRRGTSSPGCPRRPIRAAKSTSRCRRTATRDRRSAGWTTSGAPTTRSSAATWRRLR